MDLHELSPEQQQRIEADHVELEQHLARVGVDLRAAFPQMHEFAPPREEQLAGDENSESYMIAFTIDHSGILKTLRQLPDAAGTEAFVAAYNAEHLDWRDRPSAER